MFLTRSNVWNANNMKRKRAQKPKGRIKGNGTVIFVWHCSVMKINIESNINDNYEFEKKK